MVCGKISQKSQTELEGTEESPRLRSRRRHAGGRGERGGSGGRGGATNLAHKSLVGVAELAQVQQRLHHRLFQCLLCLFFTVLVPVNIPTRTRLQDCLHNGSAAQHSALAPWFLAVIQAVVSAIYAVRVDGVRC